ncbi:MAG TPA: glycosyltransferase 87 family protein [Candidatus Limnocylindrales bacterium]
MSDAPRSRWPFVLAMAGVAAWVTFVALIARMYAQSPPGAGFDLELLLTGGRRVAAGLSPYETSMLAGESVGITTLFYSYPPLVAQAFAPFAAVPSVVMLATLLIVSPLAAAAVSASIARLSSIRLSERQAFLAVLATLPFWFPFTLAALFGNLDLLFVAFYGILLLAVLPAAPSRGALIGAGVAVAVATLTKLHPAVLGVWLLARGVREWRRGDARVTLVGAALPRSWAIAAVAALVGVLAIAVSLLVGGVGPWADYVTVLRASTVVDLLDPRNLGPAVQIALALGLDQSAIAPMQSVVVVLALVVAVAAALAVDDPLESVLWAASASLVVLPVTWFHHFAVLVPFGVAALARGWDGRPEARRQMLALTIFAFLVAGVLFARTMAWLLVLIAFVLVRLSRPASPAPDQAVASTVAPAA